MLNSHMKLALVMLSLTASLLLAQEQPTNSFPLWPDGAPGALGQAAKDIPTLTPYFPATATASGATVVVCPGGGYGTLASHEGRDYALWLNEQGITAFVLKYRLGSDGYRHPAMLQDAARAVRLVRAHAADWKLDPNRIAIMGSSAGGHLASTLLTHFDAGNTNAADLIDRQSSRPNLGILCYAVITMGEFTHQGSKHNLLGDNPTAEQVSDLSNELQVSAQTPPCFLWHTFEDRTVPVENSLQFAEALRKAKVPFDLHVFQNGRHGLGLGNSEWTCNKRLPWTEDLAYWLKLQGWTAQH